MGRYIRKTTKGNWNAKQLEAAIKAVKKGEPIRKSSIKYKIPESSLRRRMKIKKFDTPVIGALTTFTVEQEKLLVEYLTQLSSIFDGLSAVQCRRIAYEAADRLQLKHKFSKKEKIAGKDWYHSFLKRNPEFSIQKPDAADTTNIKQFYRNKLDTFFINLQLLIEKYEFSPSRIYNVQETEIFTFKKKEEAAGERIVSSDMAWERANRTTVTCAMNAIGSFIPPMFIFPFENKMELMKISVPEGSVVECNSKGCADEEMYLVWLKHFMELVNPTRSDPILLILNSHNGHTSLDAYDFCKANNIHVLSLPPHTAYQMQPLNTTLIGPLKRAYDRECEAYMMTNTDLNQISVYKIADLFMKAFNKVASIDKGIRGFKLTGIWPVDSHILNGKPYKNSKKISDSGEENSESNDSSKDSSDSSSSSSGSSSESSSENSSTNSSSSDSSDDSDLCVD